MLSLCKEYNIHLLEQEYPPLLPVLCSEGSSTHQGHRDGILDLCECANFSGGGAGSEEEDTELQAFVDSIDDMSKQLDCSAP
jgi:hypothetical protein